MFHVLILQPSCARPLVLAKRSFVSLLPPAPNTQELWCKKGHVTQELVNLYKMQPVIPRDPPAPPPAAAPEVLDPMTQAADIVGQLLQNHHQGFLPNIRQQRAAGEQGGCPFIMDGLW